MTARLGPYELGPLLGRGGMGAVYRARHVELGIERALKVIVGPGPQARGAPTSGEADAGAERLALRFEREAAALARVRHRNVVAVHEVGDDPATGTSWFAMDLVEGESLAARLRTGPLPLARALDVVTQAARGVAALHEAGLVHRDVKPDNLVIDGDGRVVVIDLGLVLAPGADQRLTATGQLVGTPGYVAPEQLDGRGATPRTDVHALGLVLFEALTGRGVFSDSTSVGELMARVMSGARPRPSSLDARIPSGLDAVVARATAIEPDERFADAGELAAALAAVRLDRPPAANPSARALALAAASGAATVVALAIGWSVLGPTPHAVPASTAAVASPTGAGTAPTASARPATAPPAGGPSAGPRRLARLRGLDSGTPTYAIGVGRRVLAWAAKDGHARLWPLDALEGPGRSVVIEGGTVPCITALGDDLALAVAHDATQLTLTRIDVDASGAPSASRLVRLPRAAPNTIALSTGDGGFLLVTAGAITWAEPAEPMRVHGQLAAPRNEAPLVMTCAAITPTLVVIGGDEDNARGVARFWRRATLLAALRANVDGAAWRPAPDHEEPAGGDVVCLGTSPVDPDVVALGTSNGEVALVRLRGDAFTSETLVAPETADPSRFRHAAAHPYDVCGVTFGPGGRRLVSFARDFRRRLGEVRTWDLSTSRSLGAGPLPDGLIISTATGSPDGRLALVGALNGGVVDVFELPAGD